MENAGILLELRKVGDIQGGFYVSSYQRGYRWGKEEVRRLLDDVYQNGDKNYCLQPIVVRNSDKGYELIDGQQRLTTIYLIYKYLELSFGGFFEAPSFSLSYETREKSEEFLKTVDVSLKDDNIDFWHMCIAYETIKEWFENSSEKKQTLTSQINNYFNQNTNVIWYEVGDDVDAIDLFTRLNIGKIPLTSAELVKAMFLSKDGNEKMTSERQEEISLQWDNIEKELHDNSFWYFLTNEREKEFQTRIDLVLNLIAGKTPDNREKYFTFFKLNEMNKEKELLDIWSDIQHTFLLLKDWYEDHELFHKIGYIITSETKTLFEIYEMSKDKKKNEFRGLLDDVIRDSIKIGENYAELRYDKSNGYEKISKLLLLFNVESVRNIDNQAQRFPFDKFKSNIGDGTTWSLEHIHAQQSEGLKTVEGWHEWLKRHIPSIKSVENNNEFIDLIEEMNTALSNSALKREEFLAIHEQVIGILSEHGNIDSLHSLSNMALLNSGDNAALNNSAFDVKRNIIIKMDMKGQYIPFCTKMVFLKYYTPSEKNQVHFWGVEDRNAYIRTINSVLANYLEEEITVEKENS